MTDSRRNELIVRASDVIQNSGLSDGDKKMLLGRVPFVSDSMIEMFVQVCDEDPFGVDMVVKNLKKKLDAAGNLKQIHEIINQERREAEEQLAVG